MSRLKMFVTITIVCAVGVVGLPLSVAAQNLPVGKAVHVTGIDGARRAGKLVSIDSQTVVIEQPAGIARIPLTAVRSVTRDSNAIGVATAIGLGAGALGGLQVCRNGSDCSSLQTVPLFMGIGAGIGAGAGILIKMMRGNARTLYRAPAKTSMTLSPAVGRREVGVRGVIAW